MKRIVSVFMLIIILSVVAAGCSSNVDPAVSQDSGSPSDSQTNSDVTVVDLNSTEYPVEDTQLWQSVMEEVSKEFPLQPTVTENKESNQLERMQAITGSNPSKAQIIEHLKFAGNKYSIPYEVLYGIAIEESGLRQYLSNGQPLISGDNGIGIMQVTPWAVSEKFNEYSLKWDYKYNIEAGAQVVLGKWRYVSQRNPTGNNDSLILENWYLTIWAYNGYSTINNPNEYRNGPRTWSNGMITWTRTACYQAEVLAEIKKEFGIAITPIPNSQLPLTGIPASGKVFSTPLPKHYTQTVKTVNLKANPIYSYKFNSLRSAYDIEVKIENTGESVIGAFSAGVWINGAHYTYSIQSLQAKTVKSFFIETAIKNPGDYPYKVLADNTAIITEDNELDNEVSATLIIRNCTITIPDNIIAGKQTIVSGNTYGIAKVQIKVDGYVLKDSSGNSFVTVNQNAYSLSYTFSEPGYGRKLVVDGYDSAGGKVISKEATINITGENTVDIIVEYPQEIVAGAQCTFTGTAPGIHSLVFSVDGYILKSGAASSIAVVNNRFSFPYTFSQPGSDRLLVVKGYDSQGNLLKTLQDSLTIKAEGALSPVPVIKSINYTTLPLKTMDEEGLQIILSEQSQLQKQRSYFVKTSIRRTSGTWVIASAEAIIKPGTTQTAIESSVVFNTAGTIYTKVEVFAPDQKTLLVSREGSASDTIVDSTAPATGKWKIVIDLSKNRYNIGTLSLYDQYGTVKLTMNCLGRSASNDSMSVFRGNTPTGVYSGYLDGPYDNAVYGPYKVVNMTGVSGLITTTPRSGIWIHGGRSQTSLSPTYGCVRIFNADQKKLQDTISSLINTGHKKVGTIIISEK
ncbi:MAG: hypothetical protein A2015_04960 [Spirochaetes bacterium GWF1_31_7]|nr:MAG: hypothetical protein A2Y30_05330 [Spirochaetes bacterium GWE1_32_154]OHD48814.1 MAG: hypothetical protein A2Y29_03310 [Spirochaetes bacterium GWE2_31_10]OHD52876.1 MAG: hypothetical protein A2015_04960 [Spirochaetes bacterium GWF1_31_7]OHD80785.1 MAG: hypothetical protein A2355_16595 [Spirochaetes bacterium RIFOXYB1_FULL_32_8]HBD94670.1 hypothetical protein [Spirochaetia bacterium]